MARKAQSPNDGMTWLALMPFPAFNPLNWWALTSPHNAALATLSTTRIALDAWRAGADSMRAMVRMQQDEMLKLVEAPLHERAEESGAPAEAAEARADEQAEATAALLMRPMMEVTRAYGRAGRAFIVAQRDTMRAFAASPPEIH